MGSTASSLGADWLKGCHSYNKVPPPLKPLVVAMLGVDKCVCEGGGGATASCQGDTLADSGKKKQKTGDSSRAQGTRIIRFVLLIETRKPHPHTFTSPSQFIKP